MHVRRTGISWSSSDNPIGKTPFLQAEKFQQITMHFTSFIAAVGLVATSLAHPTNTIDRRDEGDRVTVANLTFHGGPASYSMSVPADGQIYPTSKSSLRLFLDENN
jgi:hypothetical protein